MAEATTSAGPRHPKICVRCGQDCAGRPRSRDASGRYLCGECVRAIAAQRRAGGEHPSHRRVSDEPEGTLRERSVPPDPIPSRDPVGGHPVSPADELDPIPLADEDSAGIAQAATAPDNHCTHCGALMARNAVICLSCGFDARSGQLLPGATGRTGPACINCGYSLAGLKSKRCPECGALNTPGARRSAGEAKAARDTVREAYTTPLTMFGVGLSISVIGAMIGHASFDEGLLAAGGYLLKYVVYVPIGVLVFLGCCLFWLGFDAPVHLTALRLAAVYAVTDAVAMVVGALDVGIIPLFGWLGWLIVIGTYVGLLQSMLELDLVDAVVVGLLTFLVRVAMLMFVLAWVSGLFR